jgi:FKBP-type peptidyl-prolyl cis-trans isomerase
MRLLILAAASAVVLAACNPSASELAARDPAAAAEASAEAQKNLAEGKAFLENNAKVEGVKTLPSGVQYKVVRSGPEGGVSPRPQDEIKIHYEGKLLDGEVFDSSYERGVPASYPLGGLIPAWVEALQLMKPGDEWILYVPPAQGYGAQGAGPIPGNSVLIFRIELFDVLQAGPARA